MSVRFDTNLEIKLKKTYCNNAFFFADGHSEKFESMSVRCDTNFEINLKNFSIIMLYICRRSC